jgi:hypothetical protein
VAAGHSISGDVLVTVGADQRIRAWRQVDLILAFVMPCKACEMPTLCRGVPRLTLTTMRSLPSLEHVASAFTEVCDASCVAVEAACPQLQPSPSTRNGRWLQVAVGGMGVQVVKLYVPPPREESSQG